MAAKGENFCLAVARCWREEERPSGGIEEKKTRSKKKKKNNKKMKKKEKKGFRARRAKEKKQGNDSGIFPIGGKGGHVTCDVTPFRMSATADESGGVHLSDFSTKMAPIEAANEVSACVSSVGIDWCAKLAERGPIKGGKLIK